MVELDFYQKNTVKDIIGREPSWLVSSGIGLITFITVSLFILTWFIQYPDSISAPVTMQRIQSNVKHKASVSGHLNTIYSQDGTSVIKGEALMLVDSYLDYEYLLEIERLITTSIATEHLFNGFIEAIPSKALMELQIYYNPIITDLKSWKRLKTGKLLYHKKKSILDLTAEYVALIEELKNKLKIVGEQVLIAEKKYEKTKKLFEKQLVSETDYSQEKQNWLKQKSLFNDAKISINLYQLELSELQQISIENTINHDENIAKIEQKITEKSLLFISKIKEWKKEHLVVAKISGDVSFSQDWKKNNQVVENTTLLSIIPKDQRMGAWMKVSGLGVGKIKSGQTVQIELENYSAAEFGTIEAKVNSINMIPSEDGYLVKLDIPKNMKSSHGKVFTGIPYLKGNGKIITQPRRLLTRFTDKIWYSVDKALK